MITKLMSPQADRAIIITSLPILTSTTTLTLAPTNHPTTTIGPAAAIQNIDPEDEATDLTDEEEATVKEEGEVTRGGGEVTREEEVVTPGEAATTEVGEDRDTPTEEKD